MMLRAAATLVCLLVLGACSSTPNRVTQDPGPFQSRVETAPVVTTVRSGA